MVSDERCLSGEWGRTLRWKWLPSLCGTGPVWPLGLLQKVSPQSAWRGVGRAGIGMRKAGSRGMQPLQATWRSGPQWLRFSYPICVDLLKSLVFPNQCKCHLWGVPLVSPRGHRLCVCTLFQPTLAPLVSLWRHFCVSHSLPASSRARLGENVPVHSPESVQPLLTRTQSAVHANLSCLVLWTIFLIVNSQISIVNISFVNSNFVNGKEDRAFGGLTITKLLCLHDKGHTRGQTQSVGMNLISGVSFCQVCCWEPDLLLLLSRKHSGNVSSGWSAQIPAPEAWTGTRPGPRHQSGRSGRARGGEVPWVSRTLPIQEGAVCAQLGVWPCDARKKRKLNWGLCPDVEQSQVWARERASRVGSVGL